MGRYRRLTLDQRIELTRRHRRGESAAALAAAYGVSERSVYRTVRAHTSETARTRDPTVSVAFRAPRSEIEAFEALAAEAGLGRRGSAFRALLRMSTGLLTVPAAQLAEAHHAAIALSSLGINLNQLARAVNRGKLRLNDEDRALLGALAREVEGLRRQFQRAHEEAKERQAHARAALARHGAGKGDGGDGDAIPGDGSTRPGP